MDLALDNLQRFICHKTQPAHQPTNVTVANSVCAVLKNVVIQEKPIYLFIQEKPIYCTNEMI